MSTEKFNFEKVNKNALNYIKSYAGNRIQNAGDPTGMPLKYYNGGVENSTNYSINNMNQFQQPNAEFIRSQLVYTGGANLNKARINKLAEAMINIRKRSNSLTATMLRNELKKK
jgi:hypothetical protein